MAKLVVKKELVDKKAEVAISFHGSSRLVKLATASQEELRILKEAGVDVFEAEKAVK